ncbi:MAG: AAA family ATPase [Proteobacteria bacterium]|nr:AAA family ATPase [Desulfobulbaceae bacterium]MBU4151379.1 AAA family ATPase [Pseudomonadota bacterium]
MKLAISGKGGVGKTTIIALLAHHLKKTYSEVLVIDADPSPHMAQTLGIDNPERITAIADMKDLLRDRSGRVDGSPFYNINPEINDLPDRFMLEKDGIKLMVLGAIQTGDKGCACAENTVLKRLLTKLLIKGDQAILLDMEAGVEHLGRGTIAGVDHLLVVVIPSKSSIRTAQKIQKLAHDVRIPKISFIGNSITDLDDVTFIESMLNEPLLASFPDSPEIRGSERRGTPITDLADSLAIPLQQIQQAIRQ